MAPYGDGLSIAEPSRKFGIHTRTAAARLVRRSIPLRRRGLAAGDGPGAVRLYESGLTLVEVSVGQQAVRGAVAEGVEIRPRGRRSMAPL